MDMGYLGGYGGVWGGVWRDMGGEMGGYGGRWGHETRSLVYVRRVVFVKCFVMCSFLGGATLGAGERSHESLRLSTQRLARPHLQTRARYDTRRMTMCQQL